MKNNKLAIAIPTYNRPEILHQNLKYMLPDLRIHNIPVYISDDSTNTKTEIMLNSFKKEYPFIYYCKNNPSLGHDENYFFTLQIPTEDYVWYLGDSLSIKHGAISQILSSLEDADYAFIAVNSVGRTLNLPSKYYTDPNEIFKELAWHLTLTGATIYNKSTLHDLMNLKQACHKNFPQLVIIFTGLLKGNAGLYWIEDKLIFLTKERASYWEKKIFEVFANDWSKVILDLPEVYSSKNKFFVIKSHDKHTNIFSAKSLLKYRLQGSFSLTIVLKYFSYIKLSSNFNIIFILFMAIIPIPLINTMQKLFKNKIGFYNHIKRRIKYSQ